MIIYAVKCKSIKACFVGLNLVLCKQNFSIDEMRTYKYMKICENYETKPTKYIPKPIVSNVKVNDVIIW